MKVHRILTKPLRKLSRLIRGTKREARPDECAMAFAVLGAARTKGLMIDVGAHFGSALAPFARHGWQVLAFEPDSENRKELVASHGDNPRVTIDTRAISDQACEQATFYRSEQSTGISGLSSFHPSHRESDTVEVTTLSHALGEHGIELQNPTFLKIDTEGFDLHVLRSAPWEKFSPDLILCEFEDLKTVPVGYTYRDMADFLMGRGYQVIVSEWHPIQAYGRAHDWKRFLTYPCEELDAKAWGNLFAVRDEACHRKLLKLCKLDSSTTA